MHEEIKQRIRDNVFENTYGGITGQGLQDTLLAMVDEASTDFSVLGYEEFSAENDYTEDSDPVVYEGKLYKFNTAHPAGEWIGTDADETTIDQQIKDGSGYFVEAAENTTIGGYQVPLISPEQIADINEAMSKGKNVVVIDATGDMRFSVRQSDAVDEDRGEAVVIDYFDKMTLTYYADETIEHVKQDGYVRFDESQSLTDTQKNQAVSNIGALMVDGSNGTKTTIDNLINNLTAGTSAPTDASTVVCEGIGVYVGKFFRRSFASVWEWIASKLNSVIGITATNYGGSADKLDGKHASDFATAEQGAKADTAIQNADNLITINGTTLKKGDSINTKTPEVTRTGSGDITIAPNTLTVLSTVGNNVNFILGEEESGLMNEYMIEFTTGNEPPTISWPAEVKWSQLFIVNPNSTYQISIINNIGLYITIPND